MNKLTLLLTVLFLSACTAYTTPQAIAPVANTPKPTKQATSTPVPSATIGYEQTAIVAIQTSNEAVRVNAMITAEYERRIQEQLQMTAVRDQQIQQIYQWTQQAAQTVIPLTATQQAMVNQRMPTEQAIIAARMTATAEYPSLIIKAKDAENYTKYAGVKYPVQIFAFFATGVLLLVGAWWLVNDIIKHAQAAVIEIEEELTEEKPQDQYTHLEVHKGAQSKRYKIPLNADQLTELAQAITQGIRNFEINAWQRDGVHLKATKDIQRARGWACKSQLVTVMPNNELAPKDELLDLLYGWLENQTLPDGVEIEEGGGAVVGEAVPA